MWVLGTELQVLCKTASALNCCAISPAPELNDILNRQLCLLFEQWMEMLTFLLGNKIVSAWKHLEMFRNAYEIITKNSKETKHECFLTHL